MTWESSKGGISLTPLSFGRRRGLASGDVRGVRVETSESPSSSRGDRDVCAWRNLALGNSEFLREYSFFTELTEGNKTTGTSRRFLCAGCWLLPSKLEYGSGIGALAVSCSRF